MSNHYKINRKARLSLRWKTINAKKVLSILTFMAVFSIPFYPNVLSIQKDNAFAAWTDIDLDFDYSIDSEISDLWDSNFISPTSLLSDDRWSKIKSNISKYKVISWDTIKSIAKDFHISVDTIKWANWIKTDKDLKVWKEIYVPPVSWVLYTTKKWDTLSSIATKYNVDIEDIKKQNNLVSDTLNNNITLVIPWAKYIADINRPKKTKYFVPKPKSKTISYSRYSKIKKTSRYSKKSYYTWRLKYWTGYYWTKVIAIWNNHYNIFKVQDPRWHNMAWWNCTWFVAKYRNVTWRWNAKDWLRNAQAQWVPTGSIPRIGAIQVINWPWYNRRYWHVAIVVDIQWDNVIVKDMNYRWINVVTIRKVHRNDKTILWYIYSG